MRTDIAAFLGFAEQGPVARAGDSHTPISSVVLRLTSWKEYEAAYGGLTSIGYLPYAVKAFFANGGTTCYVARVAGPTVATASYSFPGAPTSTVVTSLSAPAVQGQKQLKVEFASALNPGDTISFTTAKGSELTRVDRIPDRQTAIVTSALRFNHEAGAAVSKVAAPRASASLAQNITGGGNRIALDDVSGFENRTVIRIGGQGHTELATVSAVDPASAELGLTAPLQFDHFAGDVVAPQDIAFSVEALSPGIWGNRLWLLIRPLDGQNLSLRVTLEPAPASNTPAQQEFYPRLAWTKLKDQVNGQSHLIRVTAGGSGPMPSFEATAVAIDGEFLKGGSDGLDKVDTPDFVGSSDDRRGLRLLEEIDDIGIVCAPDAVYAPEVRKIAPPPAAPPCDKPQQQPPPAPPPALPAPDFPAIYRAVIDHCARMRYRVAVLDAPDNFRLAQAQTEWLAALIDTSAEFAALYHPWLKIVDPLGQDGSMLRLPPSGHVAGIYARTDHDRGVQKPPANLALEYADDVGEVISDDQQGLLNDFPLAGDENLHSAVNVIRAFPGRGIRVWGARSLSVEPEWRFIHTRRLLSMIENSVEKSTQWTVFEPNDHNLRRTLTHALNVFLEGIWRTGGLKGDRPEFGFFVKCDNTNNPQPVIDAGQLRCQIGVAIAAPMEFLVFEIRRLIEGAELIEM